MSEQAYYRCMLNSRCEDVVAESLALLHTNPAKPKISSITRLIFGGPYMKVFPNRRLLANTLCLKQFAEQDINITYLLSSITIKPSWFSIRVT